MPFHRDGLDSLAAGLAVIGLARPGHGGFMVNGGTVALLDLLPLLRELRGRERRRGVTGRDRIVLFPGTTTIGRSPWRG